MDIKFDLFYGNHVAWESLVYGDVFSLPDDETEIYMFTDEDSYLRLNDGTLFHNEVIGRDDEVIKRVAQLVVLPLGEQCPQNIIRMTYKK